MNLAFLVDKLELRTACCENRLAREVQGGYVGDLLSDVIANSKQGDVWITRQSHQNIVAVAALREHAGIILALGAEPGADTLNKADREGIPVFTTGLSSFAVAGMIYSLMNTQ
ncbi:MAG: DRTGG domain-containing protein [Syntrophales bacterium]|jgi:predicted transcriptional regulator|nr:DRTGG domain-containing protein [Syntrophales bacterium]MDY0044731.1 DRTGG domain-containing protein [Syntrophales bacterium]